MREKKIIKLIKKALKEDHLYSQDELLYMKKEMNSIEKIIEQKNKNNSKGFGNK